MRAIRLRGQIAELQGRIQELEGMSDDGLRSENAALKEALDKLQADFSVAQQELVALKAVGAKEEAEAHALQGLMGSSVQPSILQIGDAEVQLGDVVRRSFADSGMTVEAWNSMPEEDREASLQVTVNAMIAEASPGSDGGTDE